MTRTLIELPASGTVLDAADRLRAAPAGEEVALVVPAGAPLGRSGVLMAVAHRLAGDRPFALVSSDARVRAVAASAHVRAYSSVAALERDELDPTEREGARAPVAPRVTRTAPTSSGLGRRIAATASFLAAALLAMAVGVPSATITIAPTSTPIGPLEFSVRAGPGGELEAQAFNDNISARVNGTGTGKRTIEAKAGGVVKFTNKTTGDIALPRGTVVRAGNVRFLTTEAKSLPRSVLIPFLLSSIDVPVEAEQPGPGGNVAANAIASGDAARYDATNAQPTTGGDSKVVAVVTQADYEAAVRGVDAALKPALDALLARWRGQLKQGHALVGTPVSRLTSQLAASEVVGKDLERFEVLVAANVFTFAVANDQPRALAVARLRGAVDPGNDIDVNGAAIDLVSAPAIAENGVTYRIRASARQFARSTSAAVRAALAGKAPAEAEGLLRERGLRLVDMVRSPDWWPRLPLLDARIRIVETTQP